jgi:hypothetical protein
MMSKEADLTQQLKTARGKRYYDILKALRDLIAADLRADFEAIKQSYGKMTPVMVGVLALHYDVNYKAMCELLEWGRCLHCNSYGRIITDGGLKVGAILEAAQKVEDGPIRPVSRYEAVKNWQVAA